MADSHDARGALRAAGVVIETASGLYFVPAESALAALDDPRLSAVPGTRLHMLWFEGRVVPAASWSVLTEATVEKAAGPSQPERRVSQSRRAESALVCEHQGQPLALVGVWAVASGLFEVGEDGSVLFGDEVVPRVALAALHQAAVSESLGRNESRDARTDPSDSSEHEPTEGPK